MARKAAALLKSTPVKLDKISRDFIKQLERVVPVEGCEEAWSRYVTVAKRCEESQARFDAIANQVEKEGGTSSSPTWYAFQVASNAHLKEVSATFGALDNYMHAVKHRHDKIGVSLEDISATIIDSLSDKLSGLTFTVNYGILGHKLAQAIRPLTSEESAGDPPFCADCAD